MKALILTLLLFPMSALGLSFENIEDKTPIRANNGNVVVEVKADTTFTLFVDGSKVKDFEPTDSVTLVNMDRGLHTLRLESDGVTEEVTVYVLRVHK